MTLHNGSLPIIGPHQEKVDAESLFRRCYEDLLKEHAGKTGNRALVQDSLMDAIAYLQEKQVVFNSAEEGKRYLTACINHGNQKKNRSDATHARIHRAIARRSKEDTDLNHELEQQELIRHVKTAISQLPAQQKAVMNYTAGGFSTHDTAALLGITDQTVRNTQGKARKKIYADLLRLGLLPFKKKLGGK